MSRIRRVKRFCAGSCAATSNDSKTRRYIRRIIPVPGQSGETGPSRETGPEIGIRLAIGAQPGEVLWMILRHALLLVTAGILGGLVGSSIIAHSLSNLLFNVSPTDPVTFLAITLIFLLTAAISGLIPAFRAAKIDPAITLRAD